MHPDGICRCCLKSTTLTDSTSFSDNDFRSKIKIIFNFDMSDDKSFPSVVCASCCSRITEFHLFYEMVRANQIQLRSTSTGNANSKSLASEDVKIKQEMSARNESELDKVVWLSEHESDQESTVIKSSDSVSTLDVKAEIIDSDATEGSDKPITRKKRRQTLNKTTATGKKVLNRRSESHEQRTNRSNDENRKILEFYEMNCEFCSETVSTFGRLQTHCRNVHNKRAGVKCCDRIFYVKSRIIEHINSHQNPKRYHCAICNRYYHSKDYLELHNVKMHSNTVEKPFDCEKCDKSFHQQGLLNAHLKTHIQVECSVCHRMLANIYNLKMHMLRHSDNVKHICDTCGKEFRCKESIERHIKRHMGINPVERLQCHICSRWITGKRNLKLHMRTVHCDKNQEFSCDICYQKYRNERSLSVHKGRVHVEKKFECEFCGKKFKRSINWKEHRASHTGETLYSCDVCGMTSNSNGNLYSHKKNKHPDEWLKAKKKAMEVDYARSSSQ
ncbi:transcription factor grauzone-like [Topomyia yanbarensis]|uniref:transcription factor grauzone-like n=1 Tax=Topomyia yanbarensis TaxID=2498891 RepID=UPI00273CAF1F|nr:transcription factor grauzone-like [Topomyia yanbarensis]